MQKMLQRTKYFNHVCWVKAKREEDFVEIMSDIELANCLESKFIFQKDFIITMNNVDKIYKKKKIIRKWSKRN